MEEKSEFEYAGFWIRSGAYLVDAFLIMCLLVICLALLAVVAVVFSATDTWHQYIIAPYATIGWFLAMGTAADIISLIYFPYHESSSRQTTLGKKIMGIKIVNANGKRITYARSLSRLLILAITYVLVLPLLISLWTIVFAEKKQALHDMIMGTLVVNIPKR